MKTTSKEDYIKVVCKEYCANYNTCDKNQIYIQIINDKSTNISCSAYKKKED